MIYPLLLRGLYSSPSGANNSIIAVAATPLIWSNSIEEGRGNMTMLDVIASNFSAPDGTPGGNFSVSIGGMVVLQNQNINRYAWNNFPRSYEILQINQPPGQTIELNYLPTTTTGAVVHCYHFNQYAIPSIIAARNTSILKQRIVTFAAAFAPNVDLAQSQSFTIPTGIGNVVGIELNTYNEGAADDTVQTSLISLLVGGVKIFDEVAPLLFFEGSGRPGLIFPILIRPGQTLQFQAITDLAAGPGDMIVEMRLYFDDDNTGKKKYA